MKTKLKILPLFLILSFNLFGQSDSLLKKLFYHLTADSPRSVLIKEIKEDARFIEIGFPSKDKEIWSYYNGKVLDNGLVKTKADSITIGVTWGIETLVQGCSFNPKDSNLNNLFNFSELSLEYFFSSTVTLEKAYQELINRLKSSTSDSDETGWGSSEGSTAKGQIFHYFRKGNKTKITVLKMKDKNNRLWLTIAYQRPGN